MATSYISNGISFPASKSNNTGANVLDDYEQGAWTPSIPNSNSVWGGYVAIGSYITLLFEFAMGNGGQSPSMAGMPYGNYSDVFSNGSSTYAGHFAGNFGSERWCNMGTNGGTSVSFENYSYATVAVPANKFGNGWYHYEFQGN